MMIYPVTGNPLIHRDRYHSKQEFRVSSDVVLFDARGNLIPNRSDDTNLIINEKGLVDAEPKDAKLKLSEKISSSRARSLFNDKPRNPLGNSPTKKKLLKTIRKAPMEDVILILKRWMSEDKSKLSQFDTVSVKKTIRSGFWSWCRSLIKKV